MAAVKRYNPAKPGKFQWRGLLLYILPLPLLPAVFVALANGWIVAALARAIGFGLAMLAATHIRKGISLELEAANRRFKRRASTVPYRMIGTAILTAAMFLVAWLGMAPGSSYSLFNSLLFAAAAAIGSYLYYEFDPARTDPEVAAVGITTEELIELLDEAELRIEAIEVASKDIRNREFRERLKRITTQARAILDTIEQDPVDARRARKFLKVYLEGARQVTEGYAKSHRSDDTAELEGNFRRVLTTIETVIAEQQNKLAENNLSDLDVKIEVLQQQLEHEGVV